MILQAIGCTERTHSSAATPDLSATLRTTGFPGRTHSPATSPDLRASSDNWLPRTDSLACSLAGSPYLSGQQAAQDGLTRLQSRQIAAQLRTASCPRRNHSPAAPPDHRHIHLPTTQASRRQYPAANATLLLTIWSAAARTPHDTGSPTPQSSNTPVVIPLPVHHLSPLLRTGVMLGHPHNITSLFPTQFSVSNHSSTLSLSPSLSR